MHETTLITILGMAAVTYFSRIGGLWLMNRMRTTPRLENYLSSLPGCVLVSVVAPAVLTKGLPEFFAGLLSLFVAWKTRSLVAALITGVGSVWVLRNIIV